jgi:Lon protease-like protein
MTALHPRLDDLPDCFPVFPLSGALLLPHGRLPLNIFEPRYLAMTEDALGAGRLFGMIQPDPQAASGAEGPGLYRVGCLGRISSFSETNDGRYLITLTGLVRFEVAEELPMHRGYRRIRAGLARFNADLDPPRQEPGLDREALLASLRRYFAGRGIDANWGALAEMPDQALVVTLCMVCPFDAAEKQALLEAPTPAERAEVLLSLLLIDSHGAPADAPRRFRAI